MASCDRLGGSSPPCFLPSFDLSDTSAAQRTLLIIYIHGFCGSEESFGDFPFHLQCSLQEALHDTHIVHSKIYPRYETRNAIDRAVENFSRWLGPQEDSQTDIILVGHSLGGILAAEVALLKRSYSLPQQLRHNVIGTISMDCPFLGLNLGIIAPGIMSLFRPTKTPEPSPREDDSVILTPYDSDSTRLLEFESSISISSLPSYNNVDLASMRASPQGGLLPYRARMHNMQVWLRQAAEEYYSYWEFGRCMLNIRNLRLRYRQLRALEDRDEYHDQAPPWQTVPQGRQPRVRFMNYFTASTSGQKRQGPEVSPGGNISADRKHVFEQAGRSLRLDPSSIEPGSVHWRSQVKSLGQAPQPSTDPSSLEKHTVEENSTPTVNFLRREESTNLLRPLFGALGLLLAAFWLLISRFRGTHESQRSFLGDQSMVVEDGKNGHDVERPAKERTFCNLPSEEDPTWVRVSMEGVDQVSAHCGLFVDEAPHYDKLVLHMGQEVTRWAQDCG